VWVQVTKENHRDAGLLKKKRGQRTGKTMIKRRMQTKQKQKNGRSLYELSFVEIHR
jgi:hypothetical protein